MAVVDLRGQGEEGGGQGRGGRDREEGRAMMTILQWCIVRQAR